jgi:heterodisulfide reductase subunit B
MRYLYYPGCSLRSTGKAYEESLLSLFRALDVPLEELDDWNCCGATAYMAVDEDKAMALAARNLSLAERQHGRSGQTQLVAPCSACFLVLTKTDRYLKGNPEVQKVVGRALADAGHSYAGTVTPRHPLDVLVNDIGVETIAKKVKSRLGHLRLACYYGCQIVRPFASFDDPRTPSTFEKLMEALGAETVDWPLRTRCCGASLMGTIHAVGMEMSYSILKEARRRGANCVVTTCPLCQLNLESFQQEMNKQFDDDLRMPVAYFTQILGLALGIPNDKLGFNKIIIPPPMTSGAPQGGEPARV